MPNSNKPRSLDSITAKNERQRRYWLAIGCFTVLLATGCQSIKTDRPFPWDKAKAAPVPEKIMTVWTEAIQHKEGQASQRGFGGRVFFYDENEKPIKVEGSVTIYVFDDQRATTSSPAPEKKFVFPKETLNSHYSKCALGHSYSFWIPMGPLGGPTRDLSLITRLDSSGGGSVVSGLTRKILPGTLPAASAREPISRTANLVKQVQYLEDDPVGSKTDSDQPPGVFSQTIQLPPSFTKRLQEIEADAIRNRSQNQPSATEAAPSDRQNPAPPVQPAIPPASAHSEPWISPAPTTPMPPQAGSLPRRQPHRAEWLSGLPPTPRTGFRTARTMSVQPESELARQAEQYFRAQSQSQPEEAAHATN